MSTEKKTATQILYEHGINLLEYQDDFNTQLLHAMERYAEQYAALTTTPQAGKEEGEIPTIAVLVDKPINENELGWEIFNKNVDVWRVDAGDYKLYASPTSFAVYKHGTTITRKDFLPDLPTAKAAAEKAYREHDVKKKA